MDDQWEPICFLEAEPNARRFLTDAYQAAGIDNPQRLAFQQSTRFVYTWKQARSLYQTASQAELLIQPLLLFYGCRSLLNGLLLSRDPFFPQSSKVLQHGLTTRKLKRNPYHFLEDEVRPQKEGFFAHITKIYSPFPLQNRYTVQELLCSMVSLCDDYSLIVGASPWHLIEPADRFDWRLPKLPSGALAYSLDTLVQYLNRHSPKHIQFQPGQAAETEHEYHYIRVQFFQENNAALEQHPLFTRNDQGKWFFWNRTETSPLPIWASHFLLLYLLGMLCRYEADGWGELILSQMYAEKYLIERFLYDHQLHFPRFIAQEIKQQL
ncbi:YaaC family protein [Brevibacillus fulvus]|uniref:YaaC-like Protein n=1 Tax=Brevibacillus fulvus TaxID=1125967 RepID=A0A939BTS3_9BACL|nr:YaaC family protein [Brevibacillus fulvus]MBM7592112.1 hypothetical protein [Brevibacillus fulvus]